jgi:hypothetical protein
MVEQFIQERKYLKAVSAKTLAWYKDSFKAFAGAEDTEENIKARIVELRKRGVKPVSLNTWLRCIRAYWEWQGKEWKIPRLKEEQKVLATLSQEAIRRVANFKPAIRANLRRAHLVALTILDCGLRDRSKGRAVDRGESVSFFAIHAPRISPSAAHCPWLNGIPA